jgi:ABC-type phosphate/phosphonate transport system substrate-binding protein
MEKQKISKKVMATITIVATFLTVITGIIYLCQYIPLIKEDINVGIINTMNNANFSKMLEEQYIKPANKQLSKFKMNYKFRLVEVSYDEMFAGLKNGKIDIGFSSPYTYIVYKNGLMTIEHPQMTVKAIRGQERTGNMYYASLLYNRNGDFRPNDNNLTRENYENGKFQILIGDRWSSTSTKVIPRIYLWEKGIISWNKQVKREELLREIINAKNEQCIIGFLSSSDYDILDEKTKEKIGKYNINIPIPSDPIIINSTMFKKKFDSEKDRESILYAISSTNLTSDVETWEYPIFEKYVASGVVYDIKKDTVHIIFPPKENDILNNLNKITKKDSVYFYEFIPQKGISNSSDLGMYLRGSAKVIHFPSPNEIVVKADESIKLGYHVLFEKE